MWSGGNFDKHDTREMMTRVRTGCRKDTNDRRVVLRLAYLRLCVVVRQAAVVCGEERSRLLDRAVHLGESDDMLLLLVHVDEYLMVRAILRVVLEELREGECSVDPHRAECLAVHALHGLHVRVVESWSVLERHRRAELRVQVDRRTRTDMLSK